MPEHLTNKAVVEVRGAAPLRAGRCVACSVLAARHGPFSELDRKFIRLFGSHLADRITGIVMRRQAMELLHQQGHARRADRPAQPRHHH
jgi:hypothetical protein